MAAGESGNGRTPDRSNPDPLGEFTHSRRDPLLPGQVPCPMCGEPVAADGRTIQRKRRNGPACPTCGWRMPARTPEQSRGLVPFSERTPEERSEIGRRGALKAIENRRDRRALITQRVEERAEELAERVVDPYFAGLELSPKEEWSPSTKLDFYIKQSVLADKIFNRVEGLPVARNRNVDRDDEDVLPKGRVSAAVARDLILDLLEGSGEVEGDVIDGDYEIVQASDGEAPGGGGDVLPAD